MQCDGGSLFGVSEMLSYQDDCRESYYFENAKYHKIILLGHKNQELIENVQCTPTQFLEGQIFQDKDLKSCSKNGCIPIYKPN